MQTKQQNLKRYKTIATLLFILMLLGFVISSYYIKKYDLFALKAIRSFCEAAMVGALADWFAVTAIFRKPLGLNIPHTNLIEKNKNDIGDNLGTFVHQNFLTTENIKPYVEQINFVDFITQWYYKNEEVVTYKITKIANQIILEVDEVKVAKFIDSMVYNSLNKLDLEKPLQTTINYILKNKYHSKILDQLLPALENYIPELKELIKEKIDKKAWGIGAFFSERVSNEFVLEFQSVLQNMRENPLDKNRILLENKIQNQITALIHDEDFIKNLNKTKWDIYKQSHSAILNIIKKGKKEILEQLNTSDSNLNIYIKKGIKELLNSLESNNTYKNNINIEVQQFILKSIHSNSHQVSKIISQTVNKWNGKELSEKMELEVGKDLQFIRINGTLIGGIIGLLLFFVSYFLF